MRWVLLAHFIDGNYVNMTLDHTTNNIQADQRFRPVCQNLSVGPAFLRFVKLFRLTDEGRGAWGGEVA